MDKKIIAFRYWIRYSIFFLMLMFHEFLLTSKYNILSIFTMLGLCMLYLLTESERLTLKYKNE